MRDRRGGGPLSRLAGSANNYNFAFRDPVWHRALGPAPIHLAAIFAALVAMYGITHVALKKFLPEATTAPESADR